MKIPFGKHKGTRIKDLSDGYLKWLSEESWVKEKFSVVTSLAINELISRDVELPISPIELGIARMDRIIKYYSKKK